MLVALAVDTLVVGIGVLTGRARGVIQVGTVLCFLTVRVTACDLLWARFVALAPSLAHSKLLLRLLSLLYR